MNNKWQYGLSPEEEALAASIGFARQYAYLAKPEANRRYSEGDIWETMQHAVTAGSEIAFAKMLGIPDFIPSVNTFKTEPDVGVWEVRYKFTDGGLKEPSLRFSGNVDKLTSPYVLLTGGPEKKIIRSEMNGYKSPDYVAHGWCYPNEVLLPQHISGEENGKLTYSIPVSSLRSMSELE